MTRDEMDNRPSTESKEYREASRQRAEQLAGRPGYVHYSWKYLLSKYGELGRHIRQRGDEEY